MKHTKKLLALALMVLLLLPLGMFSAVGAFDETHVIYAYQNAITVEDAVGHPMDGDPRYIFEIPAELSEVIIVPLLDYAAFQLFDGTVFRFGKINEDTYGIFTLATAGANPTPASLTIMNPAPYGTFDATRVIYAEAGAIFVEHASEFSMFGLGNRVSFEIPTQLSEVTIYPLKDYAAFQLFDGTVFRFGKINAGFPGLPKTGTYGIFTLATVGANPTPASLTIINPAPSFWDDWPSWAQWSLKYILLGWLWMCWF